MVAEGYKKTEIGVIPIEWEVVEQKEVATFYNGRAYKLSEWEEEGTPVIRLQNLTGSGKDYYYSKMELPEHQYCSYGDLLYMWSATFGPVWWYGDKAIYHYHIWKISTNKTKLNKNFLYYLLYRITIRMKNEAHGSTMIHVTKGGMEKLKIQLPPLKEQEKIADILSTADDKIDAIASQIEKAQTLKKGLLQKLLSEGMGHSEFKDSELGKIPLSWEIVKLGNIGFFKNGINTDKENFGFGNKFFNLLDVFGISSIKNEPLGLVNISDKEKKDFDTQIGDTFFIRSSVKPSGVGLTAVLLYSPVDTVYSGFIIRFRDENKLELNFKRYCFYDTEFRKRLLAKSSVSANTNINQEALKSLQIKLPPLEEQKQIAEILSTADKKLEVLRAKKEKYETLKKGLLQKLLSGEVRV